MKYRADYLVLFIVSAALIFSGCGKAPEQATASEEDMQWQMKYTQIEKEMEAVQNERDELKEQAKNMSLTVDQLKSELVETKRTAEEMSTSAETEAQMVEVTKMKDQLSEQVKLLTAERDSALAKSTQSDGLVKKLTSQLNDATKQLDEYKKQLEDIKSVGGEMMEDKLVF